MQNTDISRNIEHLRQALADNGYSKGRILQFNSTTNQLLKFMAQHGISKYSMDIGMCFIRERYGFKGDGTLSHVNQGRLQDLTMLSEMQVHGTYMMRHRNRNYRIPAAYQKATNEFLAYRRFCGIIEKNMGTISLYLERLFHYLTSQGINDIECITGKHIHGFLRYISAYSNQSKSHMMRTVRQFLEFCWKNGYHPENLTSFAPNVHYDKRARIPSAYSYDDVIKILGTVDRSNPVGKRNYAIMLLIARLGLRTGDVCGLRFENLDWEHNRLALIQHKTGRPLTLPLLEDVGLAIIDYLKFGRPNSNSDAVFLCHRPPNKDLGSSSLYGDRFRTYPQGGIDCPGEEAGPPLPAA